MDNTKCITMKTALFTIIKDELEEDILQWVNHHLELGIDHIYIFIDYDSKDINISSSDKVTVERVTSFITEDEIKVLLASRYGVKLRVPKTRLQPAYMRKILNKYKDQYDWIGYFDIDEYIFTEQPLKQTLSEFNDIQILIVHCKVYNANGHITRPKGKITELYTTEAPSKFAYDTKLFFNMNLFNNDLHYSQHRPVMKCLYCNTRHGMDQVSIILDKIYYRHYMCKSFEDWQRKLKRGQFNNSKKYEHFFELNPDIKYIPETQHED